MSLWTTPSRRTELSALSGILQGMTTLVDRDITIAEAEALFGVSSRTLYRWVNRGQLTPIRADRSAGCKGRLHFFRLSDVAAAVADRSSRARR